MKIILIMMIVICTMFTGCKVSDRQLDDISKKLETATPKTTESPEDIARANQKLLDSMEDTPEQAEAEKKYTKEDLEYLRKELEKQKNDKNAYKIRQIQAAIDKILNDSK